MADTGPLPKIQVQEHLDQLPEWQLDSTGLRAAYRFDSTATALEFIASAGLAAEQQNHHPKIVWCYENVQAEIAVNRIHGAAERDFRLALRISGIAAELGAVPNDPET